MGQKVRPTALRLGITENWRSRWYAPKEQFGRYVVEDEHIRRHIKKNYYYAAVAKIEIERTREQVHIIVHSARPGLLIGRKGVEVDRLRADLAEMTASTVDIAVEEIQQPELSAQLVAEDVAQQLLRRSSFRQTIKKSADMTTDAGAEGVHINIAGRLGGSEMSRKADVIQGSIPLNTLTAKVDYGFAEAHTKYGSIGVKVWVNTGRIPPGTKMPEGPPRATDAQES